MMPIPSSLSDIAVGLMQAFQISNIAIIIQAFIVGALGSAAYFSAIFFGFIENQGLLLNLCPFNRVCKAKLIWYMAMGGVIASIFQLPEKQGFIPIQAFILGTTWPSIVAQILSGKVGPQETEQKNRQQTKETRETILGKLG